MNDQQLIAGRFELHHLLGRGGMGDVYLSVDTHTGEKVAVKCLHAQIVDENPQIVDRFEREGQALGKLNHPNIVKVLATVQENNRHYLIMEYVGGGSLRDLMDKESRLPVDRVLNIALDLADALTRAHRLNIIHRDIKPDNVLLAEDGTPRLTDFGVAHLGDRTRLTQTGSVIGTYAYLSPEACNGLELDERADIWSFGVMLFEMLAGRPPFDEPGTAAILTAILTKPAPDLTRLRDDIPTGLADLIARMLVKERENRLSSVRLIGAELEALIRGLDTPLRSLIAGANEPESRFATPSSQEQIASHPTHGFDDIFPAPEAPTPPPRATPLTPGMITPDGVVSASGEIIPFQATKWKWIALMVSVASIACMLMVVLGIVAAGKFGDQPRDERATSTVPAPDAAAIGASPTPLPVPPEGEAIVLVADLARLGPDERDITSLIVDDLTQTLVLRPTSSQVRVERYPQAIESTEQAREIATANHAAVIVWGSYTPNTIDLAIQVGMIPPMEMSYTSLERVANVQVQMTDPRRESVAPYVLGTLAGVQLSTGDFFEFLGTVAAMADLDVRHPLITGSSVPAHYHNYFEALFSDPAAAISEVDAALALDATNPILYALRIIALERQGDFDGARGDAETAARLMPENWATPLYLLANVAADSLPYYDKLIEYRPQDWYPYALRGVAHYFRDDLDRAYADFQQSIALGPESNLPYAFFGLTTMALGRTGEAAATIGTLLESFPDPNQYSRLMAATFGDQFAGPGAVVAGYVNVSLARYEEALDSTEMGLAALGPQADLYSMQGYAYCNLGDDAAAEEAYTRALNLTAEGALGFAYLMRADVRLRLGDMEGAEADFAAFSRGFEGDSALVIEAFKSGEVTCKNLFGTAVLMQDAPLPEFFVGAPAVTAEPTAITAADMLAVEPVGPGEVMVLVAALEPLGSDEAPDPTRFIVDDLKQTLEVNIPFSALRIRSYPAILTSDSEARAAAEATGATIVVWGNYSTSLIELNIQIGMLAEFPYMKIDRNTLDRTANVRVRLTDPRRESVAPFVIGVLGILEVADGNGYESMRAMAMLDAIEVTPATITGTSVASYAHRYFQSLLGDTPEAIRQVDAALELDAGNPILYAYRSIADLRLSRMDDARRDIETARRIGPPGWTSPLLLEANITHDESILDLFADIIFLRPDDWFPLFFRGAIYYDLKEYDLARADMDRAIALKPNANFPYIYRALLALHDGEMDLAAQYTVAVLTQFPNPSFMARLVEATFGEDTISPYSSILSTYVNLMLGRYDAAAAEAAVGISSYPGLVDLYVMGGIAYCALGAYDDAVQVISRGLDQDPSFMLAYLIRADVYLKLGDSARADADFAVVERSAHAENFTTLIAAIRAGMVDCTTLFDPNNPILQQQMAEMNATAEPSAAPVEPVGPDEYMVLVAPLEPLEGVEERDVTRFIIGSLQQTFEEDVPFSNIRIRRYPDLIRSDDEARAAAEATGAAVVVWGSYTPDAIDLDIQIGVTTAFKYIPFPREVVERTANVRVRLSDEREQSIALPVLGVLNVMAMADGGELEFVYLLAILDAIEVNNGEILGNSVAAHVQRGLMWYLTDTPRAIEEYTAAIELDAGNPLLYLYRALANIRLNSYTSVGPDVQTAMRLGPPDWTMVLYLNEPADDSALMEQYGRIAELRPDDWFIRFMRGAMYYESGSYALAKSELQRAIALEPGANLPHLLSLLIALREGDILMAQILARTIITEFPDPTMTNRVFAAIYGGSNPNALTGALFSAGTNLILGQYEAVSREVSDVLSSLESYPYLQEPYHGRMIREMNDLLLLQGLALCNLGDNKGAEAAYSRAIRQDSHFALLYVLRGQARRTLHDEQGAGADFERAREFSPTPAFNIWIERAASDQWTCQNLFEDELAG